MAAAVYEKEAFETIVARYASTVLRVCRAVVGASDADDAWSETFISAMRAYPDLPADAHVEAWLATIAHRKALDIIRRAARQAIPMAEPPDLETIDGSATTGRIVDDDLAQALTGLPPKQRQAIAYHYLAGLPYTQVAAITGGSPEAARRAAADGIASLRRIYPDLAALGRETA
jgi:RNA polymerase sigma factor (sigma-70 family)